MHDPVGDIHVSAKCLFETQRSFKIDLRVLQVIEVRATGLIQ